jgi:copper resistance protein D
MYQINVFIHVLMACVWVGGLIYTAAVVVPYAVKQEPGARQQILRSLARGFRWIGWGSLIVAIITGIGNLSFHRYVSEWLPWKLVCVGLMILLMLFHDVTSIQAAKTFEGDPASAPGNRAGSIAASIATLVAILVIYFSVRLVRA